MLRILPALSTEVLISAIGVGLVFTTLPVGRYLSDPLFFRYFGSLFGKVSFVLPGVFADNPDPERVNISLWTIAPEISCYVYLALHLSMRTGRVGVTVATFVLLAIDLLMNVYGFNLEVGNGVIPPRSLIASFAVGNLLFVWRDLLPFSAALGATAFALGCVFIEVPALSTVALLLFAYAIVAAGLCSIRLPSPLNTGDYSYGVYLYAYPIQQTFSHLLPQWRSIPLNILVCTPLTLLVAAGSWWFVEKPFLKLRKVIYRNISSVEASPSADMALPIAVLALYGSFLADSIGLLGKNMHLRFVLPVAAMSGLLAGLIRWSYLRFKASSSEMPG